MDRVQGGRIHRRGRHVRYNRQARRLAVEQLRFQPGQVVAGIIAPTCGATTPLRWRREHASARIGRDMLGRMITNIENGLAINRGIRFAQVRHPPAAAGGGGVPAQGQAQLEA